ncbi:unnamed protein product, partial [Amoebophrya sp. A25]
APPAGVTSTRKTSTSRTRTSTSGTTTDHIKSEDEQKVLPIISDGALVGVLTLQDAKAQLEDLGLYFSREEYEHPDEYEYLVGKNSPRTTSVVVAGAGGGRTTTSRGGFSEEDELQIGREMSEEEEQLFGGTAAFDTDEDAHVELMLQQLQVRAM